MVKSYLVLNPKEASDFLTGIFAKILSEENFSPDFRNAAREKEYSDFYLNNLEYYNAHFTIKELKYALWNTKNLQIC